VTDNSIDLQELQSILNDIVYVSDTVNNRIQVFDTGGNFIKKWGSAGSANGQFNRPDGILFEPSGNIVYVADRKNNRIQVFDTEGNFIKKWSTLSPRTGDPIKPRDIAVDSSGQMYVVDKANSNILIYKYSSIKPSISISQSQSVKKQNSQPSSGSNGEEQKPKNPKPDNEPKGDLIADIKIAKDPITRGNTQTVTVKFTDSSSDKPVKNAKVDGSISYVTGHVEEFSDDTDGSGEVSHSWTISGNASPGEFDVDVDVSASGHDDISESDSFEVEPKS